MLSSFILHKEDLFSDLSDCHSLTVLYNSFKE